MKLSGSPPDDIAHAWEDVKAMFNGGTRKRLMSSPPMRSEGSRLNCKVESSPITASTGSPPSKRSKENTSNSPITPPTSQYGTRPIHQQQQQQQNANNSIATGGANNNSSVPTGSGGVNSVVPLNTSIRAPSSFPQELPFSLSRSFMIDYMWHHQQTHSSTAMNATQNANKVNHFQFPPYSALNWIKQQPNSFLFKPNSSSTTIAPPPPLPLAHLNAPTSVSNDEKPPAFNHFHSAAFKPVINAMRLNDDSSLATLNTRNQSPSNHSSTSSNYNHTTASSTNQSDDEQLTSSGKKFMNRKRSLRNDKDEVDFYNDNNNGELKKMYDNGVDTNARSQTISDDEDDDENDDENEMVDIETTEDDIQILNLQPYRSSNYATEDEEDDIEVSDRKVEHNNNLASPFDEQYGVGGGRVKSPIKFLKEIVNRSEREIEESYMTKKNSSQTSLNTTLNLKKEVSG